MTNDFELTEKLYEKCGPVLRYRIANELMDKPQQYKEELLKHVLAHPEVQKYIGFYANGAKQGSSYNYRKMIHGTKADLLENTAGKLWALGIGKGITTWIEQIRFDAIPESAIPFLSDEIVNKSAAEFINKIQDDGAVINPYPQFPWWRSIFTLDGLIILKKFGKLTILQ